jgi:hypothetical protein
MTGHFTSYENRTDHELTTPSIQTVAKRSRSAKVGQVRANSDPA